MMLSLPGLGGIANLPLQNGHCKLKAIGSRDPCLPQGGRVSQALSDLA